MSDLRLDKDHTLKGQLHYVAEFVPAIPLKNVEFDTPHNEMQQAIEETNNSSDGEEPSTKTSPVTASTNDTLHEDNGFQPGHRKGLKSTDTSRTFDTVNTTQTTRTAESHGVELSKEELLKYSRSKSP